jgi:hypothetical protein
MSLCQFVKKFSTKSGGERCNPTNRYASGSSIDTCHPSPTLAKDPTPRLALCPSLALQALMRQKTKQKDRSELNGFAAICSPP